jgi:hypothetical protein
MTKIVKSIFFGFMLCALCAARAQTVNAKSCNTSDVQTAINTATEGQTVTIPAGSCTWTNGVTISGKGITVTGAGSSRVIAYSSNTLSLGTGSKSLTIAPTRVDGTYPLGPSTGQTLTVGELGNEQNYMTGTVTSFNSGTGALVMNITSDAGTCGTPAYPNSSPSNCARWIVWTDPSTATVITGNSETNPLFTITEDTSVHTNISEIQFAPGATYQNQIFSLQYHSGGQAILIHDLRITGNPNLDGNPNGVRDMILSDTNRGIIWNCSFDGYAFNLSTMASLTVKDAGNVTGNSWTSVSNMGSLDTTGQGELFMETNDFEAFGFAIGIDDNGRIVSRYNFLDNAGLMATHGADTSNYGQRFFEVYNNIDVFNAYSNGTTFNINDWIYLRGGTGLVYNNTIPALISSDYGTKPDINMTVMNLQRNGGPDACWGAGHSSPSGQNYHAPRQVGFGYVTGTGTASYTGTSPNPVYTVNGANDSITYVGDSEPFYIWGNTRSPLNVSISDYGSGGGCTNYDSSSNYIVANRDYFNGSTAKPGWSPYTYPNPLEGGGATSSNTPAAPTNLQATHN